MKNTKNLDELTAQFIGVVANALGGNITRERMCQLIDQPELLRTLLLPVAHNDWQGLLPALFQMYGYRVEGTMSRYTLNWTPVLQFKKGGCLRGTELKELVEKRGSEFLSESEAKRLGMLVSNTPFAALSCTSRAGCWFWFLRKNVLWAWHTEETGHIERVKVPQDVSRQYYAHDVFFFSERQ